MKEPLPIFEANTIFFDIDDTITTYTGVSTGETFLSTFIRVVAEANGLSLEAARRKTYAAFDPETDSMGSHCAPLGITEQALWDAVMQWLPREIAALPEATKTVKHLHAAGYRLFPATTNSSLVCRMKLSIAGLASFEGSPYFNDLFGGTEVHPKGKNCAEFFSALLVRTDSRPNETVHVGDLPEVDLRFAREAGIRQVVLPRKSQSDTWILEKDGGLYVNSLKLLPKILRRA